MELFNIYYSDFDYTQTTTIIHPIIDNNYDTQIYNNFDLIYKSDQNIINNVLKSTDFKRLQKLEKEKGFKEASNNSNFLCN